MQTQLAISPALQAQAQARSRAHGACVMVPPCPRRHAQRAGHHPARLLAEGCWSLVARAHSPPMLCPCTLPAHGWQQAPHLCK